MGFRRVCQGEPDNLLRVRDWVRPKVGSHIEAFAPVVVPDVILAVTTRVSYVNISILIFIYENIVSKVTGEYRRTLVYNSLFRNETLEIKGLLLGNLSILLLFLDLADFHLNDPQDVFITY